MCPNHSRRLVLMTVTMLQFIASTLYFSREHCAHLRISKVNKSCYLLHFPFFPDETCNYLESTPLSSYSLGCVWIMIALFMFLIELGQTKSCSEKTSVASIQYLIEYPGRILESDFQSFWKSERQLNLCTYLYWSVFQEWRHKWRLYSWYFTLNGMKLKFPFVTF